MVGFVWGIFRTIGEPLIWRKEKVGKYPVQGFSFLSQSHLCPWAQGNELAFTLFWQRSAYWNTSGLGREIWKPEDLWSSLQNSGVKTSSAWGLCHDFGDLATSRPFCRKVEPPPFVTPWCSRPALGWNISNPFVMRSLGTLFSISCWQEVPTFCVSLHPLKQAHWFHNPLALEGRF